MSDTESYKRLEEEPISKINSSSDALISHDSHEEVGSSIATPLGVGGLIVEPQVSVQPLQSSVELDTEGYSQIHILVQDWNREMLNPLLESGIDINLRTKKQQLTPLMVAIHSQNLDAVQFILENGGGVNDADAFGNTPLHKVVVVGNIPILQTLLEHGANKNAQNQNGTTPLISAAKNQLGTVLRILLTHGASVEVTDHGGYTALCYAAWRGLDVNVLLEYNANVNVRSLFGFTPLLLAVEEGHKRVILELIEHGADVNAYNRFHNTALHFAVNTGNTEIISILLDNGINLKVINNEGKSAFRLINRQDVLLAMVEKGVLPDNPGQYGLLHAAADNAFLDEICSMLEHQVDVNVKDEMGYTPLMIGANRGRVDVVELLYRNRADINVRSNRGWTAVMLATKNNDKKMISLLLQNGAVLTGSAQTNMINQEDKEAYTIETDVFGIADSEELCEYILAEMEDNLPANPNPRIPLHGMISKHRWDLVKYCLNKQVSIHPDELSISVEILQQDVDCVLPYEVGYRRFRRNVVRSIWEFCSDEIINSLPIKMWISNHMKEYGNIILCSKLLLYTIFLITLGFVFLFPLHIPSVGDSSNSALSNFRLIADLFIAIYWLVAIIANLVKLIFTYKRYWDVLTLSILSPLGVGRYMFKFSLIISGLLIIFPFHMIKLFMITPTKYIRGRSRYQRDKINRSFCRDIFSQIKKTPSLLFSATLLNDLKIDMLTDPRGEKVGRYRIIKAHLYLRFFIFVTSVLKYFSSIYNLLAFGAHLCLFGYFILRLSNRTDWWVFASPAFLFVSLNLLQYLSISFLGVYIYIIFRMVTYDIFRFFIIFSIVLVSFTGGFFIAVLGPVYHSNGTFPLGNICSPSLVYPWYNVFLTGLRTLFEQSNILECVYYNSLLNGWAVFILLVFLFTALLLLTNLLIAQLVYTYSEARPIAQMAVITKQLDFLIDVQEHSVFSLFDWKKYCFVKTLNISKEQIRVDFPTDYKKLYEGESLSTLTSISEKLTQNEMYQKKYFSVMRNDTHRQLESHISEMKQSFIESQRSLEIELKRQKDFLETEFFSLVQHLKRGSFTVVPPKGKERDT